MEDEKFNVEVSVKGGGRPFHRRDFKKKEMMFKAPTVGLETIVFGYRKPKDAVSFIKSNESLSRYVGVNFKVGGPMAARSILSVMEPDLRLPEEPYDTAGKVAFFKRET